RLFGLRVAHLETLTGNLAPRQAALVSPDLLPPFPFFSLPRTGPEIHSLANLLDVPAGQAGQALGLPLRALGEVLAVGGRQRAVVLAFPGKAQYVAALEVAAVRRLLEHQVLG